MASVIPVDRLDAGDHACLTFSDPEERFDILAAFVAAGSARGDKIIFESMVGKLFADGTVTAICEYDRESFDPVTLAYASRVPTPARRR
jgi:hypothetical protein